MAKLKSARWVAALYLSPFAYTSKKAGAEIPEPLGKLIRQTCLDCHDGRRRKAASILLR